MTQRTENFEQSQPQTVALFAGGDGSHDGRQNGRPVPPAGMPGAPVPPAGYEGTDGAPASNRGNAEGAGSKGAEGTSGEGANQDANQGANQSSSQSGLAQGSNQSGEQGGSNAGSNNNVLGQEGFNPFSSFNQGPNGPRVVRVNLIYVVLGLIFVSFLFGNLSSIFNKGEKPDELATSAFVSAVEAGRVKSATYTAMAGTLEGEYWPKGVERKKANLEKYTSTYVGVDTLAELMEAHPQVTYKVDTEDPNALKSILISILPAGITLVVMFYFMRQILGANNKTMQFGKIKAKTNDSTRPKVKFSDVAGIDEAVEELQEVRDYLAEPERFRKLGAKIPRGVLLVGPPGTGKTLLAKAVAGEAGVPFFSISGSDFVEMFVGVGASRVRDLFKEAKSQSPSIIFIDEIDAVGRQRGAGLGGGHDEREQTLNQLLVEMDGFDESESVILIAATNRPDILDPALLRPGRFDRQITVDRPDVKGREQILRVHAANKPLDTDVRFDKLAQLTVGFAGADLANLLNEAALLTARRGRSLISMDEIEESMERVMAGPQRKSRVMSETERTTIAYHESGHALVGHVLDNADPVHKISIISRGQALGYTMQLPAEDHFLKTRGEMLDELAVFLGGRVAEELMCNDITSGASNDLERATKMAREMVTRLGMSDELGTQVFGEAQHEVFLGRDYADHQDYSEETARRIDAEVQRIMREAHERAEKLLRERADQLKLMANVLLERETVEGDAVVALLDNKWDEYLAGEGEILAAKEERNNAAANGANPSVVAAERARRVRPRQSDAEIAAEAAAFAQEAMQSDAEAGSAAEGGASVSEGGASAGETGVSTDEAAMESSASASAQDSSAHSAEDGNN